MTNFSYGDLTKRNIGIFDLAEQKKLKNSVVAIAGTGGIGGLAAERLVRLGVGTIKVADPEDFEPTNLNRQFSSSSVSINQNKAKTVGGDLKKINPKAKIEIFEEGITLENVGDFLNDADVVIDGIDISASFEVRAKLYAIARKKNLYVVSSNAIGFGTVIYNFDPKGMTIGEFFEADKSKTHFMPFQKMCPIIPDYVPQEAAKKIMAGKQEYMPTISIGVGLASIFMVSEVVNILLNKKDIVVVPKCIAIDLLTKQMKIFDFGEK
jgi:molybdopterin/thiamine biosynthesis adenylyltransferase